MQTVELIDENDNVMEYKGVRRYKLKDNLIYIDELIMSSDGIKEVRIDSETVWHDEDIIVIRCKTCNRILGQFGLSREIKFDIKCPRCKNYNKGIIKKKTLE